MLIKREMRRSHYAPLISERYGPLTNKELSCLVDATTTHLNDEQLDKFLFGRLDERTDADQAAIESMPECVNFGEMVSRSIVALSDFH